MEKRQNCFNYMFDKCTNHKCPYGHVILSNKEEYLRKLKEFDFEVLERTSQTYGLLFVLKTLNSQTKKEVDMDDVKAVGEILQKFKNSGNSFFISQTGGVSEEELDSSDEEELRKYEIEHKIDNSANAIQTYPFK